LARGEIPAAILNRPAKGRSGWRLPSEVSCELQGRARLPADLLGHLTHHPQAIPEAHIQTTAQISVTIIAAIHRAEVYPHTDAARLAITLVHHGTGPSRSLPSIEPASTSSGHFLPPLRIHETSQQRNTDRPSRLTRRKATGPRGLHRPLEPWTTFNP
jgi:hypothetical protein